MILTPTVTDKRKLPSAERSGGTARGVVAVVEDDAQMSQALVQWLHLVGIRATQHSSGESLLDELIPGDGGYLLAEGREHPAGVPLLAAVLDLNLPGMTGVALAHRLRRQAPKLPVAIITGLREVERAAFGTPPHGVEFLQKPFDLDALEDLLFPLK